MYRLTFSGDEDLLDVLLPLLPGGVHDDDGASVAYSASPFPDAVLAAARAGSWTRSPPTGSCAR